MPCGRAASLTPPEQSFGYLGVAWGLGSICGSVVGGVLARPAKKWDFFIGTAFDTFPYLLTNLVNAAMMLIGIAATAVFLKEPVRPARAVPLDEIAVTESGSAGVTRSCAKLRSFFWVFAQVQVMLPGRRTRARVCVCVCG